MHPAPSVILFSVCSGLGFGLLAMLGLGIPAVTGWAAFGYYFLGYGFAVGGLLASVTHLANPKNAIKSFSQWRSSWLSREGICAIAALLIIAPYAIGRIFFGVYMPLLGVLGSVLAIATVFTTSMIYTQLKTVPRWNSNLTPVLFLGYAIAGGLMLAAPGLLPALMLLAMGVLQWNAWQVGDAAFDDAGSDIGTATGLGNIGAVRQFEPPHHGENYLLKEMAYQVGRKHAQKLRMIGLGLGLALPAILMLLAGGSGLVTFLAVASYLVGLFAIRWLFFAEARHVMGLYYDK